MGKLAIVNTGGIGSHNDEINELLSSGKWVLKSVHPCGNHAACVLAQNDQVNPDAAQGVPCENTNSAARVQRLVRPSLSGPYVKQTEADKLTAFESVFGLTPDRINDDVDVYFNFSVPSLSMANALKELGFKVGLINRWPDGQIIFEEV